MEQLFKCLGCGAMSTATMWNEATKGTTQWLLTPIEANPNAHFICPSCGEWQLSSKAPTPIDHCGMVHELVLKVMQPVEVTADLIPKVEVKEDTAPVASEAVRFPDMFNFNIADSWDLVKQNVERIHKKSCTHIDKWADLWATNKAPMLEALGETGRIVVPIVYSDTPLQNMSDFILMTVRSHIENATGSSAITTWDYDTATLLLRLFTRKGLIASEEVQYNRVLVPRNDPRREGKKIQAGTKLGVYLGIVLTAIAERLNKFYDEIYKLPYQALSDSCITLIQEGYSQAMSALKTDNTNTHYLVLSCNPLDMLLVSESTNGWDSCHGLDGGYATGGVAYMLDDVSLIAYVYKETKPYNPCEVLLPKKIWRQMIYLDIPHKSALMSREYPGLRSALGKESRRLVAKVLSDITGTEYKWKVARLNSDAVVPENSEYETEYEINRNNTWNYRDNPTYRLRMTDGGTKPVVRTGPVHLPCPGCGNTRADGQQAKLLCPACLGANHCFQCGRAHNLIRYAGRYICNECLNQIEIECADCGCLLPRGDSFATSDGERLCGECFDRSCFTCDQCGDVRLRDDAHSFMEQTYCEGCYDELVRACVHCGADAWEGDGVFLDNDEFYCSTCADIHIVDCYTCDAAILREEATPVLDIRQQERNLCPYCATHNSACCTECGTRYIDGVLQDGVCPECREQLDNGEGESLCSIA